MALLASPSSLLRRSFAMTAVQRVRAWPVESQQTARRNAMLACTSLTQRRMERQDVEDFLVSFYGTSYASLSVSSPRSLRTLSSTHVTSAVAHG
jgi:hypothetical protein